jgi:hypothetical protein
VNFESSAWLAVALWVKTWPRWEAPTPSIYTCSAGANSTGPMGASTEIMRIARGQVEPSREVRRMGMVAQDRSTVLYPLGQGSRAIHYIH